MTVSGKRQVDSDLREAEENLRFGSAMRCRDHHMPDAAKPIIIASPHNSRDINEKSLRIGSLKARQREAVNLDGSLTENLAMKGIEKHALWDDG